MRPSKQLIDTVGLDLFKKLQNVELKILRSRNKRMLAVRMTEIERLKVHLGVVEKIWLAGVHAQMILAVIDWQRREREHRPKFRHSYGFVLLMSTNGG